MTVVLFEDPGATQLSPITVSKPAFAISCGSYRLIDLIAELGEPVRALVRPHLRAITALDYLSTGIASGVRATVPPSDHAADSEQLMLVNARLVPSLGSIEALRRLLHEHTSGVVRSGNALAAALLPAGTTLAGEDLEPAALVASLERLGLPAIELDLPLLKYPHDIIRHHLVIFAESLNHRLATGEYREVADGVFAARDAQLGQYAVTDTSRGPIVLDQGASIGPYCYLSGPAYIGPAGRVIEHSAIKDGVALGHTTKVGGEVEASIIEPYTNKQHHGFLGHSYLGSWINLGAGTCNSDLKNTYGEVKMEYAGQKVNTGMQFVGAIVGDYAKTAINTGIFTGKTVGVCSMLYGFVTTNVPSFVNYARLFGQVTEAPVEVMLATQARMFARRNVQQRPCDVQLLHDMYELTRHERQLAGEPLSL